MIDFVVTVATVVIDDVLGNIVFKVVVVVVEMIVAVADCC